ncbi:MAG: hypothetical protein R3B40_27965 [Polyangiales bacterium]|nr:hypothetical protein [Myxococcales bacterium]MCB9656712.1 hypothetical protein [Sandaracinaceae bacterium]
MSQKSELKDRVIAKQKYLEARLVELRADARRDAREEARRIEESLDHVKASVKDGWDSLTEEASRKLNRWLKADEEPSTRPRESLH